MKKKCERENEQHKHGLFLTGKPAYIKHMYKHLRKEHPSTKKRMRLV